MSALYPLTETTETPVARRPTLRRDFVTSAADVTAPAVSAAPAASAPLREPVHGTFSLVNAVITAERYRVGLWGDNLSVFAPGARGPAQGVTGVSVTAPKPPTDAEVYAAYSAMQAASFIPRTLLPTRAQLQAAMTPGATTAQLGADLKNLGVSPTPASTAGSVTPVDADSAALTSSIRAGTGAGVVSSVTVTAPAPFADTLSAYCALLPK